MSSRCKKGKVLLALVILCIFFTGCLPELTDETPLALVNNEPVTYGEFKKELQGYHLLGKEQKKGGQIDIKGFIDKLIRKRLFIQEAIRVGMDKDPDVIQSLNAELKKQASRLLYAEEIEAKVVVSDKEKWEEYSTILKERGERLEKMKEGFLIDPNARPKDTGNYISMLRKRAKVEVDPNFTWMENIHCDPNQVIASVNEKGIRAKELSEALTALKEEAPEGWSWEGARQFLIDKELLAQETARLEPTEESFETSKKKVGNELFKKGVKEREDAYLKELQQKARIAKSAVDPNALLSGDGDPNTPVTWVNDLPVTMRDLKSSLNMDDFMQRVVPEERKAFVEQRVQYLIDCHLVDQEALARGYGQREDVQKALSAVRDSVLYNKFFRQLLIPSIKITDEEVEAYYKEHTDLFRSPVYVRLDEIRVDTKEEADRIWTELKAGADFGFLSMKSQNKRITGQRWTPLNMFPDNIKDEVLQAKEGDLLEPVSWEQGHSIFLLKMRKGGEVVPFDEAKKDVYNMMWKERYNQVLTKWDDALRSSSEIVIFEDRLHGILSAVEGTSGDAVQ